MLISVFIYNFTFIYLYLFTSSTVKIGYNNLGYNDKSPITTKFLCQQQNCVHLCTKTIGYNDIANNDKSQITTEFRCPVP